MRPISYDDVPYLSISQPATHPARLAALAMLFGMRPPPVQRCRVLELGCATGGNLIPLACALPDSAFVGIDAAASQIRTGQAVVDALGITNIALRHMDILDFGADAGQFDYIIVYGIYSWVPPAVREKILSICKTHLAPDGVALVSYNTYPGWHMRDAARQMMLYHSRHFTAPETRAAQARALLHFLVEATGKLDAYRGGIELYRQVLQHEQEALQAKPDFYLVHEHLEEFNTPVYFYQFMEHAAHHGLQYLSDTQLSTTLLSTLPAEVATTLDEIAPNAIAVEQYIDFLINRAFRRSLLCHAEVELHRDLRAEALFDLYLTSQTQLLPPADGAALANRFRAPNGTVVTLKAPLGSAALQHLIEQWPRPVAFTPLLEAARRRVQTMGLPATASDEMNEAQFLATTLLKLFTMDMIDLQSHPPEFALAPGAHPLASPLARLQALHDTTVVNACHDMIQLEPLCAFLLPYLDGSRDRAALLALLEQQVAAGVLVFEAEEAPLSDAQRAERLAKLLDDSLDTLGRAALLVR